MALHTPSLEDPAIDGATRMIGGRWGRHAAGRTTWFWTPLRIALGLTILVLIGGYLQKSTCLTHPYTDEYQYTRLCYTDTYALYTAEHLNANTDPTTNQVTGSMEVPYADHPVEYPPIIGGLMWTSAKLTQAFHGGGADAAGTRGTTFFNITALGLALCALISTFTIARIAGRQRAWDATMVALSPVLFMHAFTNWDLVAVAATGLGLWAWSRGPAFWGPVMAGVCFGVGTATKLYPAFVLLAILMLCLRASKWRAAILASVSAGLGLVLCYLPAIVISNSFLYPKDCKGATMLSGWRWFFSLSRDRGTDWGSVWLVAEHLFSGSPIGNAMAAPAVGAHQCPATPTSLNHIAEAMVLIVIAAVGLLVALAPRRPRVGQIAFLLVAGFVMLNKVDSPQYALWLVPLAVLARPRWASLLIWQATEVVLGAANLYTLVSLDHSDQGLPLDTYLVVIVVRDVVLLALMGLVVRDALVPRYDVVRAGGVDDPAGGVLDQAPEGGMAYAY